MDHKNFQTMFQPKVFILRSWANSIILLYESLYLLPIFTMLSHPFRTTFLSETIFHSTNQRTSEANHLSRILRIIVKKLWNDISNTSAISKKMIRESTYVGNEVSCERNYILYSRFIFSPRNRVLVNCTMITATSCGSDASIEDSKWKVGSATIIYSTFV